jgi:hypothetical protein
MKRVLILFLLLVIATGSIFGHAHDRTGYIKTGQTMLDKPMAFTAADVVATGDSTLIIVTSEQVNPTKQNLYSTLAVTSGSPSVTIKLFGKCFTGDAYVQIGSTITWTEVAHNPINISATTPNQYRYYKAEYICGGTGGVKITAFELKLWFTSGLASSGTLTDGTATINSGALAGATTGAFSSNVTVGGTLGVTGATTAAAITASGLITANDGVTLGASDDLVGSSTSDILINTDKFTVAGATGNTVIAGTLGVTGITTATGAVVMNGGYTTPNLSPVIWAKGGATVTAATGADSACTNGRRYWVEVDIPYNVTLTGIAYLIGSVGGTDSVVVQLCNSAGVEVATSKTTGVTHGAIVGTTATFQSCPFAVGATPTTYAAIAGKYYAVVQFNGTTAKFRTYPIAGCKFITGSALGTWNTQANITPGTTYTAGKGPILMTY